MLDFIFSLKLWIQNPELGGKWRNLLFFDETMVA